MINIAVIGTGDWGKNLIRSFDQLEDPNLYICCDLDDDRLKTINELYPKVRTTKNLEDILRDSKIDAVVIATSAKTHFDIAKKVLEARKHVYVEKPLTLQSKDAQELIMIAKEKDRRLMVGHLLEYHPAVNKLKELVDSRKLGDIYYIYSQRVNLGKIRQDENALWSFAPHDLSVILYLLEEEPDSVSAQGESYLQEGIEDVVFVNLHFRDKKMAHIQLSWLDPHKIRKITVVGSKKMVVFDDMESSEKIKIYDKGANVSGKFLSYGEAITLHNGDIHIPSLNMKEPLILECQHFLDCIKENRKPLTDGEDGLRVVRILEAAQKSLKGQGLPVKVGG